MFRFDLVCPVCNKTSHTISDTRANPRLKCGDCLVERVEVVEMKVVAVREERAS